MNSHHTMTTITASTLDVIIKQVEKYINNIDKFFAYCYEDNTVISNCVEESADNTKKRCKMLLSKIDKHKDQGLDEYILENIFTDPKDFMCIGSYNNTLIDTYVYKNIIKIFLKLYELDPNNNSISKMDKEDICCYKDMSNYEKIKDEIEIDPIVFTQPTVKSAICW